MTPKLAPQPRSWRQKQDQLGVPNPSLKHQESGGPRPAHLLNGVELDASAPVPDADEVIQATTDDAGGGTGEGGDVPTVSEHVADPAAGQHIPQADGPILSSTGQHHGLGEQARGAGSLGQYLCPRECPSALGSGGSSRSASQKVLGASCLESKTKAMAWYPGTPPAAPGGSLTWSMYTAVMAPEWPCRVKRQHESSRRNTWGRGGHQFWSGVVSQLHFGQEIPSVHPLPARQPGLGHPSPHRQSQPSLSACGPGSRSRVAQPQPSGL